MPARVIAIGDVHGCATALDTLLEAIRPQVDDVLIPLGDCIDRGPDSRGVIERLLALGAQCRLIPLLGNHEEMMLNYLDGRPQPDDWLECGGAATVASYGTRDGRPDVPDEHVALLRTWPDYYETDTHFFVHACYDPHYPLPDQRWNVLRWHALRDGLPDPHDNGKQAIVGHTSQKNGEVLDVGYLLCIDTYCWGGGWLTALDTTNGRMWQANQRGQLRA
jgi:Calcineurin-like phosphoesterase